MALRHKVREDLHHPDDRTGPVPARDDLRDLKHDHLALHYKVHLRGGVERPIDLAARNEDAGPQHLGQTRAAVVVHRLEQREAAHELLRHAVDEVVAVRAREAVHDPAEKVRRVVVEQVDRLARVVLALPGHGPQPQEVVEPRHPLLGRGLDHIALGDDAADVVDEEGEGHGARERHGRGETPLELVHRKDVAVAEGGEGDDAIVEGDEVLGGVVIALIDCEVVSGEPIPVPAGRVGRVAAADNDGRWRKIRRDHAVIQLDQKVPYASPNMSDQ
mmetsp:Transcript_19415/g.53923  ORF Transcript_19415/g.53923 Transcript_19415/m.53923 type:complete len:274 (-) Transcript_19415:617-1438(-)